MQRPTSPHLRIYRLPMTAVLSITHRLTGLGLIVASFGFLYWLWAIAMGGASYVTALWLFSSPLGQLGLFLTIFAFYYHLCNGVRHLAWDLGLGFSLDDASRNNWIVIAAAAILAFVTWVI